MNFTRLGRYLDSLADAQVPGCDIVIYHDHEPVYRHMAGFRDYGRSERIRGDETYNLYSCTKVITTCAAMQLIEKGLIHPDDPVSDYLPAFSEMTVRKDGCDVPCRRTMTIRHLMSMQSGMDYEKEAPEILAFLEQTGGHASTREMVDIMAARPLCFEPGTDFLYSLSHDVLGALIEVVTGKSFSQVLKEQIFDPLGMKTIGFVLREKDLPRQCAQYEFQEETKTFRELPAVMNDYMLSDRYESGGAGLVSDVHDYSLFADALACGGEGADGVRLLDPETIQLWRANQLMPRSRKSFDEWNRTGYSYALGVRTRVDLSIGGPGSLGEFGWDGAAGAWTMIDPTLRLSAFYAMHVKNYGYCYDVIHPTVRGLIYEGFFA